jgi:drug/metabolite transporter (DMT)-like permease
MSIRVTLSMLLLTIFWGSAFPAIKIALTGMTPGHLTLIRFLVASACFIVYSRVANTRLLPDKRDLPYVMLLAFLGISFYHSALNFGQQHVGAGAGSLIIATAPALSAVLASWLLGERLPVVAWFGLLLSLAGVALISSGSCDSSLTAQGFNPYALLILAAAFATSLYAVLQKRMFTRYTGFELATFVTLLGTIPLLIFAPGFAADMRDANLSALVAAIYTGIFPAALCYAIFAYALSQAPVVRVTTMLYLVPVNSTLFAWLLIAEVPAPLTLLGGVVALAGVIVVQWSKRQAARRGARALLQQSPQ